MQEFISYYNFKNGILDRLLEAGWFRQRDVMFTTDSIDAGKVYWLRYLAAEVHYKRNQKRLIKKNENYTVHYDQFRLTDELQELHALYKIFKPEIGVDLLAEYFNPDCTAFDTWIVSVRNNNTLIGAGIFDKGKDSIACIMNFYNPVFHTDYFGKYLLLLEIEFCKINKIQFCYPGYIAPSCSVFDFKKFPDKNATQVLIENTGAWVPYNVWRSEIEALI